MHILKITGTVMLLAMVSLAALLWQPGVAAAGETNQVESTKSAPVWELTDLDGKTVHSTEFKGKVVVLDFWATWCPPCRAEIPGFIKLQSKYAAQGLTVIGVAVDQAGLKTVKAFAEKNGINYPILLANDKLVDAFGGIDGLPTTFIIDRNGLIVKQHLGYTAPAEFEKEAAPLLAQ
jgi:thiol-disulfide isomerase/thioredoxin